MSKYGFDKMQIGDTITFNGQDRHGKAGNAAKSFFRNNDWNLQIKRTSYGIDVTRLSGGYKSNAEGTFKGNPPPSNDGWGQIGKYKDCDGVQWMVFFKPQNHTDDWATYKIVANGRAKNKANYWLAKNTKTGQIGYARDFVHMRANRPELHKAVEEIID